MLNLIIIQHHAFYLLLHGRIDRSRPEVWQYKWDSTMFLRQLCQSRKVFRMYGNRMIRTGADIFYYFQIGIVYSFHRGLLKVRKIGTVQRLNGSNK